MRTICGGDGCNFFRCKASNISNSFCMKHNVKLSTYSLIMSWLTMFVLLALSVYGYRGGMPPRLAYTFATLLVVMIISGFIYMPVSIKVDDKRLSISRPLMSKNIPLSEIRRVRLSQPTMAENRIFGSGGFWGYWGWFSESTVGKYFAYYGKASDCFLVELKNGRKYMLGCVDPAEIVEYISDRIN